MTNPVSGNSQMPEDIKEAYKQDFKESASLFQQSLEQYKQSTIPAQQEAFKDVMKKALTIMNETAQVALSKEAQKNESKLSTQFEAFEDNPSEDNMQNLDQTLSKLQKSLD